MILFFCAGALAASGIGKKYLANSQGFLGGFVFLSAPAAMALALQDYQDLCLALPCLVIAFWAFGTGRWYLAIVGALFAMATGVMPLAVVCAILAVPMKEQVIQQGRYARISSLLNVCSAICLVG